MRAVCGLSNAIRDTDWQWFDFMAMGAGLVILVILAARVVHHLRMDRRL